MAMPADIVIRSSKDNMDHSSHALIPGPHVLIDATDIAKSGPVTVNGVTFEAFPSREKHASEERTNAMYRFTIDGIRVFHMGDLGYEFDARQLDWLRGHVDVMLAIAGERSTICLDDLQQAIEEIKPRVVIPMHYQVRRFRLPTGYWLYPVEAFTSRYPQTIVDWVERTEVTFTPDTLPAEFRILVLDPLGGQG